MFDIAHNKPQTIEDAQNPPGIDDDVMANAVFTSNLLQESPAPQDSNLRALMQVYNLYL
jgi:hypothetical protein